MAAHRPVPAMAHVLHHRQAHQSIICLVLQITLLGWIPATIWAVYALSQFKTDQKIKAALQQASTPPATEEGPP